MLIMRLPRLRYATGKAGVLALVKKPSTEVVEVAEATPPVSCHLAQYHSKSQVKGGVDFAWESNASPSGVCLQRKGYLAPAHHQAP